MLAHEICLLLVLMMNLLLLKRKELEMFVFFKQICHIKRDNAARFSYSHMYKSRVSNMWPANTIFFQPATLMFFRACYSGHFFLCCVI